MRPGDVIRIFDRATNPPKTKRWLCVCPTRNWFFRINSNPYFPPKHLLRAEPGGTIIEDDSYVQLLIVRPARRDLARAVLLGRMTREQAAELAWTARREPTLTDEQQRFVWQQLVDGWEPSA